MIFLIGSINNYNLKSQYIIDVSSKLKYYNSDTCTAAATLK